MKKKFVPFIYFFIFLLQFKVISQTTYEIYCELDSEEKIITHCLKNLAKFKIPSEIVYVSELPRNATGKVLKRTLKEITEKNV